MEVKYFGGHRHPLSYEFYLKHENEYKSSKIKKKKVRKIAKNGVFGGLKVKGQRPNFEKRKKAPLVPFKCYIR